MPKPKPKGEVWVEVKSEPVKAEPEEVLKAPQNQESNRNPDGTFKDGISGNPGGRPVGTVSIVTLLRRRLQEVPLGQVKPWAEQMVDVILEQAIVKKDPHILKLIANYVDGMPAQYMEIAGKDGAPFLSQLNDDQLKQLIGDRKAASDSKKAGN